MRFNWIVRARIWLLDRLAITSPEARSGRWWEVDLLLVFLAGTALFGIASLLEL